MKFYINNRRFTAKYWTNDTPEFPNLATLRLGDTFLFNFRFHIRIGFRDNPSLVKNYLESLEKPFTLCIVSRLGIKYSNVEVTNIADASGSCVVYFKSPEKYKILWSGRRKWPTHDMIKTLIIENE